jgi:hypothetical protein
MLAVVRKQLASINYSSGIAAFIGVLFFWLLSFLPALHDDGPTLYSVEWVPALGLSLSLYLDGLSLTFSLIILGVGAMVALYAGYYFDDTTELNRFYSLLLAFMSAMLAVVLAGNILMLFVAWELTSILSFLLISFNNERPEARFGALQAIVITGGGGLDEIVLVEGQADAISFGAWGMASVALGGMHLSDVLRDTFRRHRCVFVLLDNTEEARESGLEITRILGPTACLPRLSEDIKDANDWLVTKRPSASLVTTLLNRAATLIDHEVSRITQLTGLMRQDEVEKLIELAVTNAWDTSHVNQLRCLMKDLLKVSSGLFNDLLKASQERHEAETNQSDNDAQILGEDTPLISPALGFTPEMAVITVSIMERTPTIASICSPILSPANANCGGWMINRSFPSMGMRQPCAWYLKAASSSAAFYKGRSYRQGKFSRRPPAFHPLCRVPFSGGQPHCNLVGDRHLLLHPVWSLPLPCPERSEEQR